MSCFDNTITLFDSAFEIIGDPITTFESLSFSDAWEKHGAMTLVVGEDEWTNVKDAAWLGVCNRVYEVETIQSDDDNSTVKINGSSLNVLFDRIVITEEERLQGRLEERVRYLVNKYAITGSQRLTNLSLGVDNDYKRAMDATTKRGQKLSEFLYTAMNQRGFSFAIVLVAGALVFNVLRGVDRTQDQSVNAPVQISTRDALEKASYKKSIKDYRNFAVVCDEDPDAPQTVEVDLSHGAPVRSMYVSGRSAGADKSEAESMFVMVGTYSPGVGYIATSTDGQSWTSRVTSGISPRWSVEYKNGKFITGGNTGDISKSDDGITWTNEESGSGYAIEGLLYDDGIYVAFTSLGSAGYSYDASAYNVAISSAQASGKIVNAVRSNDKLVAFSAGSDSLKKWLSADGTSWESETVNVSGSPTQVAILRTVETQTAVCGIGFWYDGTTYKPISVATTDNAATQDVHIIESLSGFRFLDAAYGNSVLVAVGQPNIIAWSEDDGETWTNCTPTGGTPDYIAVCFDGTTFHAYSATTKHHAYSTDGKTWMLTTFSTSAVLIDAVIYGTSTYAGTLRQIGIDALQEAAVVETLDGDINQDLAPVYETDYNNGDVVDAVDAERGISAAKRVLEVEFLIDKDNDYAIIPKLGKDFLSLRQYIAKEIRNNGV